MALLVFPASPFNGQIYPINPPEGTNVYQWKSTDQTWVLLGTVTGVTPGTYGTPTEVPRFFVNWVGRLESAENIPIQISSTSQIGLVQLNDTVTSTSTTQAATANAVKFTYDLADAAVPKSSFTTKGDLLVGTGDSASSRVPTGARDSVLVVDPDAPNGVRWTVSAPGNVISILGTPPITVDSTDKNAPVIGVNDATTTTKGVVQVGTNISVTDGTISVPAATTLAPGVVQLNNTVSSTFTSQALTAAQGKILQDQINALSSVNNLQFAGTFDAATKQMVAVTSEGAAGGFVVGSDLPVPNAIIIDYFVIVVVGAASYTPPVGSTVSVIAGDWLYADSSTWLKIGVGTEIPPASTAQAGIVELATDAETQAGADANRAVTPASLQSKVSDSVTSTSTTTIASSAAVKLAYDSAVGVTPVLAFIDDISGGFNGAATNFPLEIGGLAVTPGNNLLVFVGGVPQVPTAAYTVTNSTISFTEPPLAGTNFIAVTATKA